MTLMEILVQNLRENQQQLILIATLHMLKMLFESNTDKYAAQFDLADGLQPLEILQYSDHAKIFQPAADIIINYFAGYEDD